MKPAVLFYDSFETPVGAFSIAADEAGAVVVTAFGGLAVLRQRVNPQVLVRHSLVHDSEALAPLKQQTLRYFAGGMELPSPDLTVEKTGATDFQKKVWTALCEIPYGETRSYKQLAEAIGNSRASRAVGRANGANPVCLFVPCHRVIGADGSLTGYAFGEEIKRKLLELERGGAGSRGS
jgi:methylated-DNA-[protein]-cysteine S-methyltransferase